MSTRALTNGAGAHDVKRLLRHARSDLAAARRLARAYPLSPAQITHSMRTIDLLITDLANLEADVVDRLEEIA